MYKREDFKIPKNWRHKAYISLNGFDGDRYLTTEGKIGTWLTVRAYDGDIKSNSDNTYFPNQQQAEQALTEFLNNQNKGEKEMKKSDLKNGMIVEIRDEEFYMYLETDNFKVFAQECGHLRFDDYEEDLTNSDGDEDYDIIAIYEPKEPYQAKEECWDEATKIWERKETKELTVAQLEELLGHKVKIVK